MSLSINQFAQSVVQGQLDLRFNTAIIAAQIDVSTAGGLVPGTAVKIVDSLGGIPKVVECAADTDDIFGFIGYDIKHQTFEAGDICELAVLYNNVMYMTASAAIARNAKVMIVVSSDKVATATSGKTIAGRALDKATADGDLIRVAIQLPGAAA